MAWTRRFLVEGADADVVVPIIDASLSRTGYSVRTYRLANNMHRTHAIQTARWLHVMTQGLSQQITWTVVPEENNRLALEFDHRNFWWYTTLVVLLAVPAGWLWYIGFHELVHLGDDLDNLSLRAAIYTPLGVASMLVLARMVTRGSSPNVDMDAIRADLRASGMLLDEVSGPFRDRKLIGLGLLLGFVALLSILAVADLEFGQDTSSMTLATISMIAILLIMLGAAISAITISVRHLGSDDRFGALAPTMLTMISVLFFLASYLPLSVLGATDEGFWGLVFEVRRHVDMDRSSVIIHGIGSLDRTDAIYFETRLQMLLVLAFAVTVGCWLIAAVFFVFSVQSPEVVRNACARGRRDISTSSARSTASGQGYLRSFRFAFGIVWLGFSVVVMMLYGIVLWSAVVGYPAIQLVGETCGTGQSIDSTGRAIAYFLKLDGPSSSANLVGILIWSFPLGGIPYLVAVSVVDLQKCRQRTFRRLHRSSGASTPAPRENSAISLVRSISKGAGVLMPKICMVESDQAFARAHSFGLIDQQSIIEISTTAQNSLNGKELEAILAHEVAHFISGHCHRHVVLQYLGRFTLVGGSFAGAFENSFAYELEADKIAVQQLQISPRTMIDALVKIQILSSLAGEAPEEHPSAGGQHGSPPRTGALGKRLARWREVVRFWIAMYRFEDTASYWYPSLRERIDVLWRLEHDRASSGDASKVLALELDINP